jgi:hypothetical protein
MSKTQSQTVIVNVKQEKEKKEKKVKRKRRTTKKRTKASPTGVSQVSQNSSVQAINRGVQDPVIQQRFLAPDPQTTRVLNDLSSALQTFRQQSTPQPPPPSNAVIVSPPVGAMPVTPISRAPRAPPIAPAPRAIAPAITPASLISIKKVKIPENKQKVPSPSLTESDRDIEATFKNVEELYLNLPRNTSGTIKRRGRDWTALSEEQRRNVIGFEAMQGKPKKAKAPEPEPEPSMTKLSEPARMEPEVLKTVKPKNIRSATPKNKISMLLDNTSSQIYATSKLGQPAVSQNNDLDNTLIEVD